jgi:Cys-tRNA(Pro)/Cys-tRNA(Cys) deacylase
MKKLYPTFIDSSAENQETIAVSAGKIGQQMDVSPQLLAGVIHATFTELIK